MQYISPCIARAISFVCTIIQRCHFVRLPLIEPQGNQYENLFLPRGLRVRYGLSLQNYKDIPFCACSKVWQKQVNTSFRRPSVRLTHVWQLQPLYHLQIVLAGHLQPETANRSRIRELYSALYDSARTQARENLLCMATIWVRVMSCQGFSSM